MNFLLSEEQLMIKQAARDFAQSELLPGVIERDTNASYPTEQVDKMFDMGFLSMMTAPKYGGGGMNTMSLVLAVEEISKVDNSCSVIMSVQNSLVLAGIERAGNDMQKDKYLPRLTTGKVIGGYCLSEPEAGSDASSQRTTAVDMGDHYILNGIKNWITSGQTAGLYLVMAQTNPEKGHRGINAFIVEADWEGVSYGVKEDKMGVRSSDTSSVMFENVKVPKENRLGEDGYGFKFAMSALAGGRIGIAAQALGMATGAYEMALAYSHERSAFGKPINEHQAIAFKLADMANKIEAARMLVYRAAWLKDNNMDYDLAASMAKLTASETAVAVTIDAIQVHGGYGFVKEYHVERLMRDAKVTTIYEGTSEMQRIVISRKLIKGQIAVPLEQV